MNTAVFVTFKYILDIFYSNLFPGYVYRKTQNYNDSYIKNAIL